MCQGFGFFAASREARSRLSWSFSAFAGGGFAARGSLPLPLWWHPRSGVCCACGLVFLLFCFFAFLLFCFFAFLLFCFFAFFFFFFFFFFLFCFFSFIFAIPVFFFCCPCSGR